MQLIKEGNMVGYFGGVKDDLKKDDAYAIDSFEALREKIKAPALFFLKQTHSRIVHVLKEQPKKVMTLFENEGDAIITKEKNVGIGVVTADCLPVFLYDPYNEAIAAIHAGWKGLSLGIITATIEEMQKVFNTDVKNLKVYFGPSADDCCYEVQTDFLSNFSPILLEKNSVIKRDDAIFFSPKKYALHELAQNGVLAPMIDTSSHTCTICHTNFCSFRRDKASAGRQASIIYLEEK